jgi:predicted small lipoprotein YifL
MSSGGSASVLETAPIGAAHLTEPAVAADDCRLMSRGPTIRRLVVVAILATMAGCGKKGPPLPPLHVAPNRIEDLTVAKTGEEVRAQFTIPAINADQSKPADIVAVELYAMSGKPEDPQGQSLGGPLFIRFAKLAGRVDVAPVEPPEPARAGSAPDAAKVADRARAAAESAAARARQALPAQGTVATIVERLTKDDYTPFVHPDKKTVPPAKPESTAPHPLGPAPVEEAFSRTYLAVGISKHGSKAQVSNRVSVPLVEAPPAPTGITVTHAEATATITWTEPPGAWHRVQRAASTGEIAARSLAADVTPTTYNVYRVTRTPAGEQVSPQPINATPVETAELTQGPITLGEVGCYQVRAVRAYGSGRLESAPSATVCTAFADTFPPPPPTNLAAVGSEAGVSLIWDPSPGGDVAGYIVLRGEIRAGVAPATLMPITAEPIHETTYRDATPRRGVRYVYAVAAVDGASPRNQSAESNRVEEGAR